MTFLFAFIFVGVLSLIFYSLWVDMKENEKREKTRQEDRERQLQHEQPAKRIVVNPRPVRRSTAKPSNIGE